MSEYFVIQDQQQVGPFTKGHLQRMLQSGEVSSSDFAWRTGLEEWRPLSEILAPAVSPVQRGNDGSPYGYSAPSLYPEISWVPALAFYSATVGFALLGAMAQVAGSFGFSGMVAIMSIPVLLAALVFWGILHYQCWRALPPEYAATTPGKAVGFLFIPFYNFYWAFVSWPKLSVGFDQLQIARWGSVRINTRAMAMGNAVLFVTSLGLMVIFPEAFALEVILTLASFSVFVLYYRPVVQLANTLR